MGLDGSSSRRPPLAALSTGHGRAGAAGRHQPALPPGAALFSEKGRRRRGQRHLELWRRRRACWRGSSAAEAHAGGWSPLLGESGLPSRGLGGTSSWRSRPSRPDGPDARASLVGNPLIETRLGWPATTRRMRRRRGETRRRTRTRRRTTRASSEERRRGAHRGTKMGHGGAAGAMFTSPLMALLGHARASAGMAAAAGGARRARPGGRRDPHAPPRYSSSTPRPRPRRKRKRRKRKRIRRRRLLLRPELGHDARGSSPRQSWTAPPSRARQAEGAAVAHARGRPRPRTAARRGCRGAAQRGPASSSRTAWRTPSPRCAAPRSRRAWPSSTRTAEATPAPSSSSSRPRSTTRTTETLAAAAAAASSSSWSEKSRRQEGCVVLLGAARSTSTRRTAK